MIRVEKLSKHFGKTEVLSEIDLKVAHGEIVCVLGRSGSGKSTLLRCLNLLELPDGGRIDINGRSYSDAVKTNSRAILDVRRQTAMVFQSHQLFPDRTAVDNIALGLRKVKGLSREDAMARANSALASVGLAGYGARYPAQLSGGQQQRVGIARATALEPAVVLMDEPTSALDPGSVEEVLGVIRQLARQHITMMIVTHEIKFALEIADRIVLMEAGRIRSTAPPDDIRKGVVPEISRFMRSETEDGTRNGL